MAPLHTATNNDNVAVVSALVAAGANPNLHGIGGATPLHIGVSDFFQFFLYFLLFHSNFAHFLFLDVLLTILLFKLIGVLSKNPPLCGNLMAFSVFKNDLCSPSLSCIQSLGLPFCYSLCDPPRHVTSRHLAVTKRQRIVKL